MSERSTSGTRTSTSSELFEQLQSSVAARRREAARASVAKARTRDSMQAFAKLTRVVDGEPRIVADPPLIVPLERPRRRPPYA